MKLITYLFIILIFTTCKNKTTITFKVFNFALNEQVPNAKVVLIEHKEQGSGGFLSPAASCKEIAEATTDANGNFDKERLKINSSLTYFLVAKLTGFDNETQLHKTYFNLFGNN